MSTVSGEINVQQSFGLVVEWDHPGGCSYEKNGYCSF